MFPSVDDELGISFWNNGGSAEGGDVNAGSPPELDTGLNVVSCQERIFLDVGLDDDFSVVDDGETGIAPLSFRGAEEARIEYAKIFLLE